MAYKNVDRKLPPKGLAKLGWFALIAGLWVPTYWVAASLNFSPKLNSLVQGFPVYLPGQVIYWAMDWAKFYPSIFAPALVAVFVSILVFIVLVRKSRATA